ncbi:MAG: restriction endonuclease subunit S [Treponema sp.]|uniref:restriction endonuclease subunit S n=1 Tax=Treponema sp. TaxID=166 RepID=UPI0025EED217|nr:restriction endonuclease subunit S [Treponema sp.]MBQ9281113.1 restriction endonuclease subunit S [Treponema sp.]
MSEWKKVKIGDICKIVKGTTGIASAEPGEYPLVVTAEERKTCSTYQFDCEAVCIPLVSSSGHGKKSLKNVHYQSGKFALGTILCAVIPNNPQELDARYLHQYLQFYKDIILVPLMKGAANVSLSMKDIATVEFPLPPIERQRELSNLFVSLQEKQKELSAEYEKQTEYAKLLRQNILQQAIEGKLTADWRKQNPVQKGNPDYDAEALFEQIQKGEVSPSLPSQVAPRIATASSADSLRFVGLSATPSPRGKAPKTPDNSREFFEEKLDSERKRTNNARSKSLTPITDDEKPFEIPEGWKWVHFGEISINRDSERIPLSLEERENLNKIYDYYGASGVIDKVDKYIFDDTLLLIGEDGANLINRSTPIAFIASGKFWVNNHAHVIDFDEHFIVMKYVMYFINAISLEDYITGTAQPKMNQANMNKIPVPLPPLKEQDEIVNKVETLLAKVTPLENQIQDRKLLSDKLIFGIIKENLEG